MPFLLTRISPQKLKTDAKVDGASPYRNNSREWHPDLWAEQRRIQQIPVGEAILTSGQAFDAKCGIVTVPPIWEGGSRKEALRLAACYDSSLRLAHRRRCKSIAFPLLSGDCNGFPRDLALKTAMETILEFLQKHDLTVYLSVQDSWVQMLPKPVIPVLDTLPKEESLSPQALFERAISGKPMPQKKPRGLFRTHDQGQDFLKLLKDQGHPWDDRDPALWQKANLDRKCTLKLNSLGLLPKTSALAILAALELPGQEVRDLMEKGGFPYDPEDPFDRIVEYYLESSIFDVNRINYALFVYNQPLLGE